MNLGLCRYEEAVSAGAPKPQQAPKFEASDLESPAGPVGPCDLPRCPHPLRQGALVAVF